MPNCAPSEKSNLRKVLSLLRPQTLYLFTAFLLLFLVALARTHLRNRATIVGYEIGRLKKQELSLLEQRSRMQVQLARLTSKDSLLSLANDK